MAFSVRQRHVNYLFVVSSRMPSAKFSTCIVITRCDAGYIIIRLQQCGQASIRDLSEMAF